MEFPKKLVAAISGGVDSSVAAALCLEKGVELVAVTLKMRSCENMPDKRKSCCGIEDDIFARGAAEKLGIPHYFLNVKEEFEEKVLKQAWQEYSIGRTPNPCTLCNRYLKFGTLIDYAIKIGAGGIITGHYAIIDRKDGKISLRRGVDPEKDQTYFLFGLTPEQLSKSYMPLGPFTKREVRGMARKFGLPNAEKTESQDACFGYKDETFAQTLQKLFNGKGKKGHLKDMNGKILGEHDGIHLFTIGQRKGLGIALGSPAYVVRIDAGSGDVTVSSEESNLMSDRLIATGMNWQIADFAGTDFKCMAQVRYRSKPVPAMVKPLADGGIEVQFERPQRAITPGQSVVLYDNDILIGGGWIL
ncbi:MAG TPA: tRNA 2-thiouridine(34) synthase MnmA [Lentisphaeria bacterium]|nr:MAG: tRNA 2-thiouridine(34) synthase MnmA [Lentisphaerae bacterium GWF2_49_21]HBC87276.1 tRNA 2-thiouridine(34) synthase MnmA [Lentisphaeria bacterium]